MGQTRRQALQSSLAAIGAGCWISARGEEARDPKLEPFSYSLNTATIMGQKVGIVREIEIAAEAGYQAIEPWMRDLEEYVKNGGKARDLANRISDAGLRVESAIGFANWLQEDQKSGLDQARRDMELVAEIGGKRIAAPPVGMQNQPSPPLPVVAERFRALCEVGEKAGVVPQVEVWGFSQTLKLLAEVAFVAIHSGYKKALILPDTYHLRKGGSPFEGIQLLSGESMQVFHVNDYPGDIPIDKLTDADRVFPGDGQAPNAEIFQSLARIGFKGVLSLELFNRTYWAQDPLEVARKGLQRTRETVRAAFSQKSETP